MSAVDRLPFSYARRHGVLLDAERLYCRADTALAILAEVRRRHAGAPRCQVLGAEDFARRLAERYRDGRDDAMQVAEGLGAQIA
ncbi:type II secretion system protein GspE, partial [Pseudomonas aeruginosa]|nr:type II secretion system protein GspE [Pseudomonas aeruginosa]